MKPIIRMLTALLLILLPACLCACGTTQDVSAITDDMATEVTAAQETTDMDAVQADAQTLAVADADSLAKDAEAFLLASYGDGQIPYILSVERYQHEDIEGEPCDLLLVHVDGAYLACSYLSGGTYAFTEKEITGLSSASFASEQGIAEYLLWVGNSAQDVDCYMNNQEVLTRLDDAAVAELNESLGTAPLTVEETMETETDTIIPMDAQAVQEKAADALALWYTGYEMPAILSVERYQIADIEGDPCDMLLIHADGAYLAYSLLTETMYEFTEEEIAGFSDDSLSDEQAVAKYLLWSSACGAEHLMNETELRLALDDTQLAELNAALGVQG